MSTLEKNYILGEILQWFDQIDLEMQQQDQFKSICLVEVDWNCDKIFWYLKVQMELISVCYLNIEIDSQVLSSEEVKRAEKDNL